MNLARAYLHLCRRFDTEHARDLICDIIPPESYLQLPYFHRPKVHRKVRVFVPIGDDRKKVERDTCDLHRIQITEEQFTELVLRAINEHD